MNDDKEIFFPNVKIDTNLKNIFLRNYNLEVIYLPNYNLEEWGELKYKYDTDSGFDLRSCNEDFYIYNKECAKISVGVKFKIPDGYQLTVRPRSGLSSEGIICAIGTIDQNYRGEIFVIIYNLSKYPFCITKGDRIAQCIIEKRIQANIIKVDEFNDITDRNENGFGSTGKK